MAAIFHVSFTLGSLSCPAHGIVKTANLAPRDRTVFSGHPKTVPAAAAEEGGLSTWPLSPSLWEQMMDAFVKVVTLQECVSGRTLIHLMNTLNTC